jgi:hypothetical protein
MHARHVEKKSVNMGTCVFLQNIVMKNVTGAVLSSLMQGICAMIK